MSSIYNRRQIIKRGFGGFAGLSVLGGVLAGCATSNAATPPAQGPVKLQMLFWGNEIRDKLTRQAIGYFQEKHAGVTITTQYTTFDPYWPKLNELVAANNTPDLIQMDMRYLSQYVRKGLLLDLTPLIYNQTIDLSDFDPLLLAGSKANNTIYGIPMGGNYPCLFYDQGMVEQAGIGAFPENMNWQEYADYCIESAQAYGDGQSYGAPDDSHYIGAFEIWIRGRGKELYTYDGKLGFELADVVEWYTYWDNLRKAGGCMPPDVQKAFENASSPLDSSLLKRKALFIIGHSNVFESYQKAAPVRKLQVAMPPRGPQPSLSLKASQLICIAAQTKYSKEAADFVNFIINDREGVKTLGLERGVPGSVQARALLRPGFTPEQVVVANYVDLVSKSNNQRLKAVLDPPGAGQVSNRLRAIAQEIKDGKLAVAKGAEIFYNDAQKGLAGTRYNCFLDKFFLGSMTFSEMISYG